MNGIVIVDKPQDWTSQDVTARLRRVFNTRRIGHGGTLDPMATGVLPVFVGRATRGVEFFEHAEKTYEATLRLGITTDTEDVTGTVLQRREVHISEADFLEILPKFRGKIQQIPPMYSALKINGQKLVDLARKGKEVERQPREIQILNWNVWVLPERLRSCGSVAPRGLTSGRCARISEKRWAAAAVWKACAVSAPVRIPLARRCRCRNCWKRRSRRSICVRWTVCSAGILQ